MVQATGGQVPFLLADIHVLLLDTEEVEYRCSRVVPTVGSDGIGRGVLLALFRDSLLAYLGAISSGGCQGWWQHHLH